MKKNLTTLLTLLFLLACPLLPSAQALVFFGEDLNFSYTGGAVDDSIPLATRPNSDAARNSFFSHLIGVGTEDFEGFSGGATPTTLMFGPIKPC